MEIALKSINNNHLNLSLNLSSDKLTGITGSNYQEVLDILSLKYIPDGNFYINKIQVTKDNIYNIKKQISYIPFELVKEPSLIAVREYMEYMMSINLVKVKDSNKKIIDSLKIVGLNPSCLDKNINILSKSEIKLIQIAIGLLSNPNIIILDDPFKFLDLKNKKKLHSLLLKLQENYNKLIIIGTNNSMDLYKYTKWLVLIKDKQVLLEYNTKEIYENIDFLQAKKFNIPQIAQFTYKAQQKNIKIGYHNDIRDIIKDIYKHV